MQQPVVATSLGPVRGIRDAVCARFLGIPYAAAPVGDRRFEAPQPHEPWVEPRDATRYGPTAPYQLTRFDALDLASLVGEGWIKGDDYLNLNIWTPSETATRLPVFVFIHGGAWTGGSGAAPVHDGTAFARDGVVCVTHELPRRHRRFSADPGGADQPRTARHDRGAGMDPEREIAAFGGDPANVTVAGESAGAMSIADLMASPLAKGLFRRAIIQSGHGSMVRPDRDQPQGGQEAGQDARSSPTLEGFRTVSAQRGLDALDKVQHAERETGSARRRRPRARLRPEPLPPVFGDDVIPVPPLKALDQGAGAEVDLLIGTNLEEMNIYLVPTGANEEDQRPAVLVRPQPGRAEGRDGCSRPTRRKGRKAGDVLGGALTDLVFRWPARVFAARAQGADAHL